MTSNYFWDEGDECESCGCHYPRLQKDHIVPKADGGTDELSNIWYICPNCHDIKSAAENTERNGRWWDSLSDDEKEQFSKRVKAGHGTGFSGRSHTDEARKRQSEASSSKRDSDETREKKRIASLMSHARSRGEVDYKLSVSEERKLAKRIAELEEKLSADPE